MVWWRHRAAWCRSEREVAILACAILSLADAGSLEEAERRLVAFAVPESVALLEGAEGEANGVG